MNSLSLYMDRAYAILCCGDGKVPYCVMQSIKLFNTTNTIRNGSFERMSRTITQMKLRLTPNEINNNHMVQRWCLHTYHANILITYFKCISNTKFFFFIFILSGFFIGNVSAFSGVYINNQMCFRVNYGLIGMFYDSRKRNWRICYLFYASIYGCAIQIV